MVRMSQASDWRTCECTGLNADVFERIYGCETQRVLPKSKSVQYEIRYKEQRLYKYSGSE